jgi:hypothetical protein
MKMIIRLVTKPNKTTNNQNIIAQHKSINNQTFLPQCHNFNFVILYHSIYMRFTLHIAFTQNTFCREYVFKFYYCLAFSGDYSDERLIRIMLLKIGSSMIFGLVHWIKGSMIWIILLKIAFYVSCMVWFEPQLKAW